MFSDSSSSSLPQLLNPLKRPGMKLSAGDQNMKISSRLCRWLLLKIGLNPDLEVKLEVEMAAVRRINKGILIEHQE